MGLDVDVVREGREEVCEEVGKRMIDVHCLQEVRWRKECQDTWDERKEI